MNQKNEFYVTPIWKTLLIGIAVGAIASSCSGSHHHDSSSAAQTTRSISNDSFGQKVCTDHCGVWPPKTFTVMSWADVTKDDLCGLPWKCQYRCSSDCR